LRSSTPGLSTSGCTAATLRVQVVVECLFEVSQAALALAFGPVPQGCAAGSSMAGGGLPG